MRDRKRTDHRWEILGLLVVNQCSWMQHKNVWWVTKGGRLKK